MKNNLSKLTSLVIKYPIYIGVIAITFFVRETYPFSMYPMYNNFPNWSYTFYFEDQKKESLGEIMSMSYGSLNHLYFTECQKSCVYCGFGSETTSELQKLGDNITKQALNMSLLKANGITEVYLFRIHNYIKNRKTHSDTITISRTYVR